MSKVIGVIAEDHGDVEVIREILRKYLPEKEFKIKKFVGGGCGKLQNKCGAWAGNLFEAGCEYVFVFHDLDRNNQLKLRKFLESKVCPKKNPKSLVVIPTEELEAWLLSDSAALKIVFNLPKSPKTITNCEAIKSPKEHLQQLIYKLNKTRYINTVHNQKIAEKVSLDNLRRCESFKIFDQFMLARVCSFKP